MSASQPLDNFTLFSSLPFELRFLIWKFAIPGPRLICASNKGFGITFTSKSGKALPAIFHICRESRAVAFAAYDYCLSTSAPLGAVITILREEGSESIISTGEVLAHGVFFQPARDTIRLIGESLWLKTVLSQSRAGELRTDNIRSLAVSFSLYELMPKRFLKYDASFLSGLEELIVVGRAVSGRVTGDLEQMKVVNPEVKFPVVKVMTSEALRKSVPASPLIKD